VLFFGRVRRYKGIGDLISAGARVASEIPAVRFVIAGESDRETRQVLAKAAPPLFEVRDRFISDAEAAQLFLDAELLVLPYIEGSQSGALAAAYTFGLPVVATKVGEIGDMVAESETGIVVPVHNPQALAEAIVVLLRDEKLRARLAKNALKMAERELGPAKIGASAVAVYDQVLKRSREKQAGKRWPKPTAK
jgi:glycosyltransferase involved in cell wall biosynthesis